MRSVAETIEQLRSHGFRVTPQRECIMRHLDGNTTHPTVEAIFEAARSEMSTISLKTVYQTVHDLDSLGAVRLIDLGTGSVRVDPNVEIGHQHRVCVTCGDVRDVTVDVDHLRLSRTATRDFRVDDVQVLFRGECTQCRDHASSS
jgi:Fur family transcriptional regulator, stress-responsive regulator